MDIPQKPLVNAVLTGTIRDPEGSPIPDMPLEFIYTVRSRISGPTIRARTDTTGTFRVELVEGTYGMWVGSTFDGPSDFPAVSVSGIRVTAPVTRFDYAYSGFPISGLVTGPAGTPLDSARVFVFEHRDVYSDYNNGYFTAEARAGPNGYKLFLPRAGRYDFFVEPSRPYSGIVRRGFPTMTIAADTTVNFSLDGVLVTGTVTLGGVPLDSVQVFASFQDGNEAVLTDVAGHYQMHLPAAAYDWALIPMGPSAYIYPYRQFGPDVQGPSTVDFDLSGIHWTGVVRNSSSGDPVTGVRVKAWYGSGIEGATDVTDASGQFDLIVRRPARYNLFVTPSDPALVGTTIYGILAGNDSTFDLTVSPVAP